MEQYFYLDPDFRRVPKNQQNGMFCCICQKDLKPREKFAHVYLNENGMEAVLPEFAAADAAAKNYTMIKAKVGPECAKKIPDKFIITE